MKRNKNNRRDITSGKFGEHEPVNTVTLALIQPGTDAIEFDVLSLVDNTHPSATQLFQEAVMRDGLAYE
jgi:hypothetical protein